jgi:hypothetical protein
VQLLVTNLRTGIVRIESTELLAPHAPRDRINAFTLAHYDRAMATSDVQPGPTDGGSASFFIRQHLGRMGRPLRLSFRITDHHGIKYVIRNVRVLPFPGNGIHRPGALAKFLSLLKPAPAPPTIQPQPRPAPADVSANFSIIKGALLEERRQYTANGRLRGGLGSVTPGLQSEPNLGWTEVGKVPPLLWEPASGTPVASPNADRAVAFHSTLSEDDRDALEQELLNQLDRSSQYTDVAYFVFLVLYRVGRGLDALNAAQQNLRGDTVNSYSNVLGVLAALVSREHFSMDRQTLEAFAGVIGPADDEFRLREKLNLAVLRHTESGGPGNTGSC